LFGAVACAGHARHVSSVHLASRVASSCSTAPQPPSPLPLQALQRKLNNLTDKLSGRDTQASRLGAAANDAADKAAQAGSSAKSVARDGASRAGQAAQRVQDKTAETGEQAAEGAKSLLQQGADKVKSAAEQATGQANDAVQQGARNLKVGGCEGRLAGVCQLLSRLLSTTP
jgi:hypothetical protein